MRTTPIRTSARRNLARLALVAAASTTLLAGLVGTGHAASATVSVVNDNDVQFIGRDVTDDIRVTSDFSGAVFVQGIRRRRSRLHEHRRPGDQVRRPVQD